METPCKLGRRSGLESGLIGAHVDVTRGWGHFGGVLTKRDELLFLVVLALPYASSTGLAWTIWSSSVPCGFEKGAGTETDGGKEVRTGG